VYGGVKKTLRNKEKGMIQGKKIVVWFSCGAASAVAAKLTIEKYGMDNDVIVCNTPILEEDIDNRRFLADVEKWIGQKIELVVNSEYPECSAVKVWNDRKYMSGIKGAPCTKELKKEARYQWTEENNPDYHVLGFTADEKKRHDLFVISEIQNVIPVLIEHDFSKGDCFFFIESEGIDLPAVYKEGFPNANCIGCVKATSPTYWNHVRLKRPEVFKQRCEQSRRLKVRLVRHKGKRIFLDELPEGATGRPMKNMSFECGIFCEVTN
jgi:3'-phosphoadenosine 5'-phosphosulfate sulfotransferase (PAPS reductase)/FAD synthetase